MADGGWHSMAEVARLYDKSWKWVQNQVKRHNISTEKRGNQRVVRLVDFIAQLGEPPRKGTKASDAESETVTTDSKVEAALFKQENQFLRRRIEELEADRADWKAERSQLHSIIEKQTYALPAPKDLQPYGDAESQQILEKQGAFSRFMEWVHGR